MKIQTRISVTYNEPNSVVSQETGIVTGVIDSVSWMNNFNTVGVNYKYIDSNGAIIKNSSFELSGEDIDNLYNTIKSSVPAEGSHRLNEETKYYLAFIYQMSNTFGIQTSDIELVLS